MYILSLYHLLHLAYAARATAHPYIYLFIFLLHPLDITALSELEAQAFRYTRINIC